MNTKPEAWIHGQISEGRGWGGGDWKRLAKEHMGMAHGHRQQCHESWGRQGLGGVFQAGGKWGISVVVSTIKILKIF